MIAEVPAYEGRPCTVSEMTVGNTLFTVISVQSDKASETAFDKVKRLLLADLEASGEKYQIVQN